MAKAKESPARSAQRLGTCLVFPFMLWRRRPACGEPAQAGRLHHKNRLTRLAVAIASCLGGIAASPVFPPAIPTTGTKPTSIPRSLTLVRRTIRQDQGAWQVEYRFRNAGPTGLVVADDEVAAKVEGWVSNSRVAAHALPRWSTVAMTKGPGMAAEAEVIAAPEESKRCKERLSVSIWPDDGGACEPSPSSAGESIVSLAPGGSMRVRLRLEHQHAVYGDYDPLLGARSVELEVGPAVVRELLPLDREQYLAMPRVGPPEVTEDTKDRRDARRFLSAPDSLHIEAHIPGHQYYRFPERPVRYDTRMRLRFWYLIAEGTEGDCRLRLSQVRNTPVFWRTLPKENIEQCLKVVGRWTKVERIVRTDAEATHVTLEFGIINDSYIGEMWIDDVSLEPLGIAQAGP